MIVALFVSVIAMIFCSIAAGVNFGNDNVGVGISMMGLFVVNTILFAANLWRLIV